MNLILSLYRAWRRTRGRLALDENHPRIQMFKRLWTFIFLGMFGIATIYILVMTISGAGIFQPRSPGGILRSAKSPGAYLWTAEAVHTFAVSGAVVREDWSISSAVDTKHNRYLVQVFNALPSEGEPGNNVYIFESDGNISIRNTLTRQQAGKPWLKNSDPCRKQPSLAATYAAMPSGKLLADANPHIVTTGGSYLGSSAWIISFEPTPEIIRSLAVLPFLDKTTTNDERRWLIDASELAAIDHHKYKTTVARAWVSKRNPRTLEAIEIQIKLSGGRSWHFLASLRITPGLTDPLENLRLPRTLCPK